MIGRREGRRKKATEGGTDRKRRKGVKEGRDSREIKEREKE